MNPGVVASARGASRGSFLGIFASNRVWNSSKFLCDYYKKHTLGSSPSNQQARIRILVFQIKKHVLQERDRNTTYFHKQAQAHKCRNSVS